MTAKQSKKASKANRVVASLRDYDRLARSGRASGDSVSRVTDRHAHDRIREVRERFLANPE